MGVEHLVRTMNNDTDRGYLAHAHILRLLTQSGHWPTEALESNPLKLPTLRILRLTSSIRGLSLENLPPLCHENKFAASLRTASQAIDATLLDSRRTIKCQQGTREYDKLFRQSCKPLQCPSTLLKHLVSLWETDTHRWSTLLTAINTFPPDTRYHIQNTEAILTRLPIKKLHGS
jgi:hypothetical protein